MHTLGARRLANGLTRPRRAKVNWRRQEEAWAMDMDGSKRSPLWNLGPVLAPL